MHEAPADSRSEAAGLRRWFGHNAWRLVLLFAGVLLPLAGFVALADEIHEAEALHVDHAVLLRMKALASPALNDFFVVMSKLGYQWGVIPLDVLIVGALMLARCWRKAAFAATAFVGSALLNVGSKQIFQRERPTLWESIAPESTFSFPSGHAMGSMTLALTVLLLAWPTRWRWPVVVWALLFVVLVGLSRIYLGVHFPSDILGGWCAALVWVLGVYLLMFRRGHTLPA
jgi:membrane-associated phospholipid phosphatase